MSLDPILRRIVLVAMLVALVCASLLPAGWMPAQGGGDRLTLELCTPDGPQQITVDLGTPTHHDDRQDCSWALAHAAIVLPDASAVLAAPATLVAAAPLPAGTHLLAAVLPGPRTARAPPTLA